MFRVNHGFRPSTVETMQALRTMAQSRVPSKAHAEPSCAAIQDGAEVGRAQYAERALLGAFLLREQAYVRVMNLLCVEDFECDDHRLIFSVVRALHGSGRGIDTVSVREELQKRGALFRAGGDEALLSLTDTVPVQSLVQTYLAIVKERACARALQQYAIQAMRSLRHGNDSAQVLRTLRKELERLDDEKAAENLLICSAELEARHDEREPRERVELGVRAIGGGVAIGGELLLVPAHVATDLQDAVLNVLEASPEYAVVVFSASPDRWYDALRRRALERKGLGGSPGIDGPLALSRRALYVGPLRSMRQMRRAVRGLQTRHTLKLVVLEGLRATKGARSERLATARALARELGIAIIASVRQTPSTSTQDLRKESNSI